MPALREQGGPDEPERFVKNEATDVEVSTTWDNSFDDDDFSFLQPETADALYPREFVRSYASSALDTMLSWINARKSSAVPAGDNLASRFFGESSGAKAFQGSYTQGLCSLEALGEELPPDKKAILIFSLPLYPLTDLSSSDLSIEGKTYAVHQLAQEIARSMGFIDEDEELGVEGRGHFIKTTRPTTLSSYEMFDRHLPFFLNFGVFPTYETPDDLRVCSIRLFYMPASQSKTFKHSPSSPGHAEWLKKRAEEVGDLKFRMLPAAVRGKLDELRKKKDKGEISDFLLPREVFKKFGARLFAELTSEREKRDWSRHAVGDTYWNKVAGNNDYAVNLEATIIDGFLFNEDPEAKPPLNSGGTEPMLLIDLPLEAAVEGKAQPAELSRLITSVLRNLRFLKEAEPLSVLSGRVKYARAETGDQSYYLLRHLGEPFLAKIHLKRYRDATLPCGFSFYYLPPGCSQFRKD